MSKVYGVILLSDEQEKYTNFMKHCRYLRITKTIKAHTTQEAFLNMSMIMN